MAVFLCYVLVLLFNIIETVLKQNADPATLPSSFPLTLDLLEVFLILIMVYMLYLYSKAIDGMLDYQQPLSIFYLFGLVIIVVVLQKFVVYQIVDFVRGSPDLSNATATVINTSFITIELLFVVIPFQQHFSNSC